MVFYSLQDNQCDNRIMGTCRNSGINDLNFMVEQKIEYHSIDDSEEDDINFRKMFEDDIKSMGGLKGKISCLMDFDFSIVKHDTEIDERDDGYCPLDKNGDYVEVIAMTFDEAVQEFS
jgi:hypothetical protein